MKKTAPKRAASNRKKSPAKPVAKPTLYQAIRDMQNAAWRLPNCRTFEDANACVDEVQHARDAIYELTTSPPQLPDIIDGPSWAYMLRVEVDALLDITKSGGIILRIADTSSEPTTHEEYIEQRRASIAKQRAKDLIHPQVHQLSPFAEQLERSKTLPLSVTSPEAFIVSHKQQNYSIGDNQPITLTTQEDKVLQAFLHTPSLSFDDLKRDSSIENAAYILRQLTKKYSRIFQAAIRLPGGKGQGGYRVSIRTANG